MIKKCYLCESINIAGIPTKIRDVDVKPELDFKILKCNDCDFVFLSHHDHIVEGDFYENSKMLKNDRFLSKQQITNFEKFESWKKNANFDDERRKNMLVDSVANKSVLDYGCGAGGFINKINQFCNSVAGVEPDTHLIYYLKNSFVDLDIPVYHNLDNVSKKFDFITCFHVMEHIKDPISELKNLKKNLKDCGKIIIEVPNINDALLDLYDIQDFRDWYFWTCHLYYYSQKSLRAIGEKAGYKVDYVKQIQRFPLSNHIHWLQKNKPNGHKIYDFLNNDHLNEAYSNTLSAVGMCDTLIMRLSNE